MNGIEKKTMTTSTSMSSQPVGMAAARIHPMFDLVVNNNSTYDGGGGGLVAAIATIIVVGLFAVVVDVVVISIDSLLFSLLLMLLLLLPDTSLSRILEDWLENVDDLKLALYSALNQT